jgi:hypothetical protein
MARPEPLHPTATSPIRWRTPARLGACVAAAAVLITGVSACGGSSKQSTPLAATATTTGAGAGGGGTTVPAGSATTTGGGAAPTTATPATTAAPASSGGGGSFCNLASSELAKSLKATAALGSTPADLRAEVTTFEKIAPALLASVPSSIRPQMASLFDYDKLIFSALAKANYNYAKISPADLQAIESGATKVEADSTAIEAYVQKACGFSLTPPTTT